MVFTEHLETVWVEEVNGNGKIPHVYGGREF
jgi:hypothetical protein